MAGYLGSVPVPQATQHRETFTATAGQTTFNTAGYTPLFVDVYLNGVHLSPADITATNGSDVVLGACVVNDIVDVVSYTPFEVANQTFTGTTTMTDVVAASLDISGDIDIDGTANLDIVDIDGAVNMATTLDTSGAVTVKHTDGVANVSLSPTSTGGVVNVRNSSGTSVVTLDGRDSSVAITGVLTTTAATVFNGGFASNAASSIGGTTPTLTIGDAGAEDAKIIFDGNAIDYHIGLDDSADSLVIGKGSALGTTSFLNINSDGNIGVNVIPEGSNGTWRNFQLGGANIAHRANGAADVFVGTNYLFESDNGEVLRTAEAGSRMFFNNNIITFQTLATGDAGSDLSATETLKIDASGNIIIANTGGTLYTATAGTSNFRAGVNAGNSIVSNGNQNVVVGDEAGTALTNGDGNVALGYKALFTEDTGNFSTAIGQGALRDQNGNADNFNTAVGYQAGLSVTDGIKNTLIGGLAGDSITTADFNTAVGYASLIDLQTGDNNTAIGSFALANTTGANHTAVGYQAGVSLTTGINSTFVGSLCGDGTVDGDGCTAVGRSALSANCGDFNTAMGFDSISLGTGVRNTVVGAFAMGEVANSGGTNTVMGYAAGYHITSGGNNLILGNDAGRAGTPGGSITTGSNTISLGNNSIATANIKVDWTVSSDQRDKTDFTALDIGLDFVKALNPVTYKWDERSDYGDQDAGDWNLSDQTPDGTHKKDWLDVGFKAQEVEALEQAAGYNKSNKTNLTVSLSPDGNQYGMKYSKFVPILVKAIQEQNALIEALTARIATLEG